MRILKISLGASGGTPAIQSNSDGCYLKNFMFRAVISSRLHFSRSVTSRIPSSVDMPKRALHRNIILLYVVALVSCSNSIAVFALAADTVVINAKRHLKNLNDPNPSNNPVKTEDRYLDPLNVIYGWFFPATLEHLQRTFESKRLDQSGINLFNSMNFHIWLSDLEAYVGHTDLALKKAATFLTERYTAEHLAEKLHHAVGHDGPDMKTPIFTSWKKTLSGDDLFAALKLQEKIMAKDVVKDPSFLIWAEYVEFLGGSISDVLNKFLDVMEVETALAMFMQEKPDPKVKSVSSLLILRVFSIWNTMEIPKSLEEAYHTLQKCLVKEPNPLEHYGTLWWVEYSKLRRVENWPQELITILQEQLLHVDTNLPETHTLAVWAVKAEINSPFDQVGKAITRELLHRMKEPHKNIPLNFISIKAALGLDLVPVDSVADDKATSVLVQYFLENFNHELVLDQLGISMREWLGQREYYRLLANDGEWALNQDVKGWLKLEHRRLFVDRLAQSQRKEELLRAAIRKKNSNRIKSIPKLQTVPVPQRSMGTHHILMEVYEELQPYMKGPNLFMTPGYAFFHKFCIYTINDSRKALQFIRELLVEKSSLKEVEELVFETFAGPRVPFNPYRRAIDLEFSEWLRQGWSPDQVPLLNDFTKGIKLDKNSGYLTSVYKKWYNNPKNIRPGDHPRSS